MVLEKNTRGATDDWEALQILLNDNPSLKQRVINRMRALRSIAAQRGLGISISHEETKEFREEEKRRRRK